jgi:hypothetical protein
MSIQTTNLSNRWEREAQRQAEAPAVDYRSQPAPRSAAPPNSTLAALKLSTEEVRQLVQKGLCGAQANVQKEVLDLVRLTHPDGWTILIGYVRVTPDLATRWLKANFGNRPVSDDTVNAYARDAVAGMFLTTHQGIAFNDKDELIDGQHRLLGIVKSGVACVLMASFGWVSEIKGRAMKRMDVIDRGRPRSVADQLKIQHGLKNGSAIAQITTQLANLCCPMRTRKLSVGQALEIYRAFEPAVEWVIERRSKQHGLKSAGVLAAFAFALMTEPKVQSPKEKSLTEMALMLEMLNGGNAPKAAAMFHLHEFLTGDDAILLQRSADRGIAELVLNGILFQCEGRTVQRPHDLLEVPAAGAELFRERQAERVEKIAVMFRLPEAK